MLKWFQRRTMCKTFGNPKVGFVRYVVCFFTVVTLWRGYAAYRGPRDKTVPPCTDDVKGRHIVHGSCKSPRTIEQLTTPFDLSEIDIDDMPHTQVKTKLRQDKPGNRHNIAGLFETNRKVDWKLFRCLFNETHILQKLKTEEVPFDPADATDSLLYAIDLKSETKSSISGNPKKFLETYRNPCWITSMKNSTPYDRNPYAFVGEIYNGVNRSALLMFAKDTFNKMATFLEERRAEKNGTWRMRCVPYLYIAGVGKSGTTDLFDGLTKHPDVVPGAIKEPNWWNRYRLGRDGGYGRHPVSLGQYLDLYDHAAEIIRSSPTKTNYHPKITVDASSTYLWDYDGWVGIPGNGRYSEPRYLLPHALHTVVPNAKIVLMLRNPTDRVYSEFRSLWRNATVGEFHREAIEAIDVTSRCLDKHTLRSCIYNNTVNNKEFRLPGGVNLRASLYHVFLRDWLGVFPSEQIHVIRSEDYFANRTSTINGVLRFVGLEPLSLNVTREIEGAPAINTRSAYPDRSAAPMLNVTRLVLDKFFKPFNMALTELLQDTSFLWFRH